VSGETASLEEDKEARISAEIQANNHRLTAAKKKQQHRGARAGGPQRDQQGANETHEMETKQKDQKKEKKKKEKKKWLPPVGRDYKQAELRELAAVRAKLLEMDDAVQDQLANNPPGGPRLI
jgi:hypothetical protein